MARPQSPEYDKRREAIVAAAAKLFAKRGFTGASMADLATECGTSKALIYHYFPSKDDLLFAVMESHLDDLVEAADIAMMAGDARTRLRTLTKSFLRLYAGADCSHKVLLNELGNLPPMRRALVVTKQRRIIAVVEALVGEIRPEAEPLRLPATMLFFGMINWTHTWFRPGGEVNPEQLADMVVDLMLGGLPNMSI